MNPETRKESSPQTQDPVEVAVPIEFFNMRVSVIVLICFYICYGLELFGPLYGEKNIPIDVWWALGLFILEILLWGVGLQLWARVKVVGYWWLCTLAHIGFLTAIVQLVSAVSQGRTEKIVIYVIKALFFFILMLVNIWSKRLLEFFKRLNGRCPLCLSHSGGEPKKKRRWTCAGCHATVVWTEQK